MDGIHDLGGMSGFGSVESERDEPVFHEPWEALAFAMNALGIAVLGAYNTDEYRHAVERMDPTHYLTAAYYERVHGRRDAARREGHRRPRRPRSARRRSVSALAARRRRTGCGPGPPNAPALPRPRRRRRS